MPPDAPMFSIILPARNMEAYLAATLDSLAAQTLTDWEALIVDDGSTDATRAIAEAVAARDPRLRCLDGPARGVSAARNYGLAAARGRLILFLDSDDLLAPDALARYADALERTEAPAAVAGIQRVAEDATPLASPDNRALVPDRDHLLPLLRKNFIVNGGALPIRAEALDRAGGYDETLDYGEDWELWCRLAELGDFAMVPGPPALLWRQRAAGANARLGRGAGFARRVDCLDRLGARDSLRARLGGQLRRALRARRIDIFWSGIRGEAQFGSRRRAALMGLAGLVLYPDSVLRPQLALRLIRSL